MRWLSVVVAIGVFITCGWQVWLMLCAYRIVGKPVGEDPKYDGWIAYWSAKHGIPIRKGGVSGSSVVRSGVVRHSDLGVVGGNYLHKAANLAVV